MSGRDPLVEQLMRDDPMIDAEFARDVAAEIRWHEQAERDFIAQQE